MEVVGTRAPSTTRGEMGLGSQRSVTLAVAVATCAPRSPDVRSAGVGVEDVGAAAAAPCVEFVGTWAPKTSRGAIGVSAAGVPLSYVRSRSSASSNATDLSGVPHRIAKSSSSVLPPTEPAGATAVPVLVSVWKRHCGVGTRSGGRPPRVAGAPGVVIIEQIQNFTTPFYGSPFCAGFSQISGFWPTAQEWSGGTRDGLQALTSKISQCAVRLSLSLSLCKAHLWMSGMRRLAQNQVVM